MLNNVHIIIVLEYKKKLYSFQEDAEQLEGFQTQEMAKIKHFVSLKQTSNLWSASWIECVIIIFPQLLAKEQEVEEKSHHLKAATAEIESLKTEVSRLRRYEDELNNVQVSKMIEREREKFFI